MGRRSASGSAFAEDPRLDARAARPSWLPSEAPTAHLVDVADAAAPAFDLWSAACERALVHDGRDLALTCHPAGGSFRATLGRGLEQGQPFGVGVWEEDASGAVALSVAATEILCGRRSGRARPASRLGLPHLRALIALDAEAAGASDHQIAATFTSENELKRAWAPDSAVRALVRDALKRGRAFRDRRWRELVWPGRRSAEA